MEQWLRTGAAGHTTTAIAIMAVEHTIAVLGVDPKHMLSIADNFALATKTADLLITGVGSSLLHHIEDSRSIVPGRIAILNHKVHSVIVVMVVPTTTAANYLASIVPVLALVACPDTARTAYFILNYNLNLLK